MSQMFGDFPVMADGRKVGRVTVEQIGLMTVFDCSCDYKSSDILRLAAVCDGKYVPLGITMPYDGRPDAGGLHLKKSFTKNALLSVGYRDPLSFHLIRANDVYTGHEENSPARASLTEDTAENAPEPIVYNDFPDPEAYYFEAEPEENEIEPEPPGNTERTATPNENNVPEPQQEPAFHDQAPVLQPPAVEPATAKSAPNVNPSSMIPDAGSGWIHISSPGNLFDDLGVKEACEGVSNAFIREQDGYVLLAVPVLPTEPFPMMPVFCFGSSGEVDGQDCIIFKIRNGNLAL